MPEGLGETLQYNWLRLTKFCTFSANQLAFSDIPPLPQSAVSDIPRRSSRQWVDGWLGGMRWYHWIVWCMIVCNRINKSVHTACKLSNNKILQWEKHAISLRCKTSHAFGPIQWVILVHLAIKLILDGGDGT